MSSGILSGHLPRAHCALFNLLETWRSEEHYNKAEQLAAKAREYLGQGDGQDTAAVWAAVTQVHAALAVAAAIDTATAGLERHETGRERIEIPAPEISRSGVPNPRIPGVGPLPGW